MRNWTKRMLSLVVSVVLLAGLLCTGATAAAAEANQPNFIVELNGEPLRFTNALPESSQGRNFLPADALFRALGAEITTAKDNSSISATRNGITVTMTAGSDQAVIKQGDSTYTLPMDVAAYKSNDALYVPIRFAAQAMGCTVGWDNDEHIVILVDTASLIKQAVEANEYTLLEKYNAYVSEFNQDNWAFDLNMAMSLSVLATEVVKWNGSGSGITADGTAGEMKMDFSMDMTGMVGLMGQVMGLTETQLQAAMGSTPMVWDLNMEMRFDMEDGKIYMLISGLPEEAGLPEGTWLSLDLASLLDTAESQVSMSQLLEMEQKQGLDVSSWANSLVSLLHLDDRDTAYQTVRTAVDAAAAALSDSAFTKDGLVYTNKLKNDTFSMTFQLTTNSEGDVVGYSQDADVNLNLKDLGVDVSDLAVLGGNAETIQVIVKSKMDEKDAMTMTMSMKMGDIMTMDMDATGQYTATESEPQTSLPKDAVVVDYLDWLGSVGT